MSNNTKTQLQSENTKSNFGKGWIIILYSMVMFFFLIGFSIDGQNIVIDVFAGTHWESLGFESQTALHAKLLELAMWAGFIGVLAYFIIGRITTKIGGRMVATICMILAGASYIYYGNADTITSYFVGLTLVTIFINGAAYIGGGNLVTQWFPKKKGLANGYTTMGHNLGSALYVPLIAALIGALGMAKGMTVTGVAAIVIGIIAYFFIRNTPQELNIYPDNVSKEVFETEYASDDEVTSRWTVGKLLKTKEMWLVAVIIGINQLVTTGVMSQMVPRNMEFGFSQATAVSLMTVCAIVGLAGSFGFGFIDQKLGVKTAVKGYLAWYAAALLINVILNNAIGGYIAVAMIGIAIGAAANFMTSLPASVFGRHNFDLVYSIYFPIMQIVLMLNYIVNAKALEITGSLRGAYIVFIVLLVVNFVLISVLDTKKYNLDYMKEEQVLKQKA
ncbi:OFA family oxalate/formate antiporter-like MFS transporter [Clostridiales Family XIII bacterium PM5-7]